MEDYEVERKISTLERKVDDLGYEIRRAVDSLRNELESKIEQLDKRKADTYHNH